MRRYARNIIADFRTAKLDKNNLFMYSVRLSHLDKAKKVFETEG